MEKKKKRQHEAELEAELEFLKEVKHVFGGLCFCQGGDPAHHVSL